MITMGTTIASPQGSKKQGSRIQHKAMMVKSPCLLPRKKMMTGSKGIKEYVQAIGRNATEK
jgi:hypothetical protein